MANDVSTSKGQRPSDLTSNPRLLSSQKPPAINLSSHSGLFNALLPKVYATKRPRRHGYGPGIEITTLLVHKLDIPIIELQSFTKDRSKLKDVLNKIKATTRYYELAIEEGRGQYRREDVLNRDALGYDHDLKRDTRKALVERIGQIDADFLFKEEVALTLWFLEATDYGLSPSEMKNPFGIFGLLALSKPAQPRSREPGRMHLLSSQKSFKHHMEIAQKIYTDWFRESWNHGKRRGRVFLREKTWTADDLADEIASRVALTSSYARLMKSLSKSIPPPSSTFHPFPRLPVELRARIWELSWEPRIVEIQGSKRHHFDNMGAEAWKAERADIARDVTGSFNELAVLEDEEGDDWVYRDAGRTRWERIDKIKNDQNTDQSTTERIINDEDALEDRRWSAEPAYECLRELLEAETELDKRLKASRGKIPSEDADFANKSLAIETWVEGPFGARKTTRPRPIIEMPRIAATRILFLLSKIRGTQYFHEYRWPHMPEYVLFQTIFKKIENGKDDEEILLELKTAPKSSQVLPSFWDEQTARQIAWDNESHHSEDAEREPDSDPIFFSSPATPPASLFVCFESRKETKRHYDCAFNDRSLNLPGIYINYEIDTVLCVYETFGNTRLPHELNETPSGWVSGLWFWDLETQNKIRRMALTYDLIDNPSTFDNVPMNDKFPALEEVALVVDNGYINRAHHLQIDLRNHLSMRYQLVGYHKTHLAFNTQFPGHDNEFFRDPFKRYLDAPDWVPGLDGPIGVHEETMPLKLLSDRATEPNIPGIFPIGPDYIRQIQKAPITLTTLAEDDPLITGVQIQMQLDLWKVKYGQENTTSRLVTLKRANRVAD